ncbi:MAG: hypothetical protein QG574_4964 [Cyanobacteriota bacterium erpe_2018_sw_21hr_WHONDRS-SW48-000092_B_bin.40]|nr:hypothetical protein [Cyanobacteriota bacterium erpe_2018_sw_21hr_WHONDRS-SW48-000092_B_bin.40]
MNLNDEKVAQFKELFPASSHSISRKPNGLSSLHRSSWYQKLFTHIMKLDIQAVDVAMPGVIEVEPMKILVSAGIALTPAQSAEDSRASFATIRYGWYFRDLVHGEGLVLPAECAEIETRLKTVL